MKLYCANVRPTTNDKIVSTQQRKEKCLHHNDTMTTALQFSTVLIQRSEVARDQRSIRSLANQISILQDTTF